MGCICGDEAEDCGTFRCAGCDRTVPWCFGAADDAPELCDDCAPAVDALDAMAFEMEVWP